MLQYMLDMLHAVLRVSCDAGDLPLKSSTRYLCLALWHTPTLSQVLDFTASLFLRVLEFT
jgi:hypothetical protein